MESSDEYLRLATSEHKRALSKHAFGQELRLACMVGLMTAPEEGLTLSVLADLLDVGPSSIQKPLLSMERCGLIWRSKATNQYRLKASAAWRYAQELMTLEVARQDPLPFT